MVAPIDGLPANFWRKSWAQAMWERTHPTANFPEFGLDKDIAEPIQFSGSPVLPISSWYFSVSNTSKN